MHRPTTKQGRPGPRLVRTALAAGLLAGGLAVGAQPAAAAPSVSVQQRTLIVQGGGGAERLALRLAPGNPNRLQVDFGDNGSADAVVDRARFDRIRLKGGGGNDRLRIDDANGAFTTTTPTQLEGQRGNDTLLGGAGAERLLGGRGTDTVDGNRGDDNADLGRGDDRFVWDPGDGSDAVAGRGGSDALIFNGANVAEQFRLAPNGSRARFTRDVASIVMDLAGVERVDVAALGGADTLTVEDMIGTDVRRVNEDLASALGGAGSDGAADTTIVNGSNGADTIAASGAAGTVRVTGLTAALRVAHGDPARDALTLNALGGEDTVNASDLRADALRLTTNGGVGNDSLLGSQGADLVNGGDGKDTAFLGAGDDVFVWNPGDDDDVVEGQAGRDEMLFNGANISEDFDVSANGGRVRFFRNVAAVTMDLNDVEAIDLNALGGADRLTVGDLSGTDLTQVTEDLAGTLGGSVGDGQADAVIVNATSGDDVITASGSGGTVALAGLATRVDLLHAEAANDRLTVNALAGDDVVEASGLAADAIAFTADGGAGADVLIGGAGADTLRGGADDDVLLGGPGLDVLDGGPGNNIVIQD